MGKFVSLVVKNPNSACMEDGSYSGSYFVVSVRSRSSDMDPILES